MRLSEFLIICDACGADPVQTLREIITEARRMELEQQTATTKKSAGERFVVDESTSEPDWLSMAAKHGDIEAEQEAYEEMP